VTDVIAELRTRKRRVPFEPFVILLKDGRRFTVARKFQYAFTDDRVVVLDERELHEFFKPADIAELETLHPVG